LFAWPFSLFILFLLDSFDHALDFYTQLRFCLKSGPIVTEELQNAFKGISLKQFHALRHGETSYLEPLVFFYDGMLKTLHERGLEELYTHHFSAYHDLALPLLRKYPSDGNLLFPLYHVAHGIDDVNYQSFIWDQDGDPVEEFDMCHGLDLTWDLFEMGHTSPLAGPVRYALTSDLTLRSITFCGQSHATISLECLQKVVSFELK